MKQEPCPVCGAPCDITQSLPAGNMVSGGDTTKMYRYASPTPARVEDKIRKLASLRVPHIAPYNLGDMGKINDLIIELERLLPPQTKSKDR